MYLEGFKQHLKWSRARSCKGPICQTVLDYEAQLHCFLPMCSSGSEFPSLSLSFPICKMGT